MVKLSFGIVALGANLPTPDRRAIVTLRSTIRILHDEPDISISAISRIWRTPAIPAGSGPDYANAVATIRTPLGADAVLARLHAIEAQAGRDRSTGRWSARVLDLDLIALDDLVLPDPATQRHWVDLPQARQRAEAPDRLILPHPRMQDRGFVLGPLAEIAPGWRHPVTGLSTVAMLRALGPAGVAGMEPARGPGTGAFP